MLISPEIQKRIKRGRETLKDDDILDQLSINEIVTEQLRLNSMFIQKHQKLYQKFLKKTKKKGVSSKA